MQGARSGAPETYQLDRREGEHRATQQMAPAVVFQQPVKVPPAGISRYSDANCQGSAVSRRLVRLNKI